MNKKKVWIIMAVSLVMLTIGLYLEYNSKLSNDDKKDGNIHPSDILKEAYNKTKISNAMNGYTMKYILTNSGEEERYLNIVAIQNYMNQNYLVTITNNNVEEATTNHDIYYIIDGITYLAKDDGSFEETEEGIIYNNTEIYLKGLNNAKKIVYQGKASDDLSEKEYDKYMFSLDIDVLKEILERTELDNIVFDKGNIECGVWIDERGYMYRIIYEISSGTSGYAYISLGIRVTGYNESSDFVLPFE